MSLYVKPVESKTDLREFVKIPWKIYKGNKCWVPPLISDAIKTLDAGKNPALKRIEHKLFLAFDGSRTVGRIYAGIDHSLNKKKNTLFGFISLFECINNYEAAELLFNSAAQWLKEKNMAEMKGPFSPTGTDGDEYKGLLVDCFDRPPVLMNTYNPPYYKEFFEKYGFEKDYDLFAYIITKETIFEKNPEKVIEYAKKKYNFRVDPINIKNIGEEAKALKHVLDLAIPDEWPDLVPPSFDDVMGMAKKLKPYADPDLIIIARSGEEPVGFAITLPDYNQALAHLNGRLTPLSVLKFLWFKRKINCARIFVMFVVPAFRKKGASFAIYYQIFANAVKKGYTWGEGSTIGETNLRMRADIESLGGRHYKTYRVYKKEI